ncbi:MAG: RNA polymerase sigma factor [Cyclobacteriaceae bacterium]
MSLILENSNNLENLIKACLQSDRKAQRDLYERFAPLMYSVCLRYVSGRAEAEDVMLRGFMKVFENLKKFRQEGSFEGWIRRIMVNESLMYIRRNKNMYLEVDIEEANTAPMLPAHDLHEEDLMRMVQALPIGYRTIFNLYAIEGYAHHEIAEMLSISEGTSKSQLSRARLILRQMIARHDEGQQQSIKEQK